MITAEAIKTLRDQTGLSVMQCKKALEESGGDFAKALENLKNQGAAIAAKKSDRSLGAGVISTYLHSTKTIGALIELDCETDFVAKNPEFGALAYDIAMQVAAAVPQNVTDLLAQPFIKDGSKTISDLIQDGTQKFGEKIEIRRIERYAVLS